MRWLSTLLTVLLGTAAHAQVQQSGNVTPGHAAMWTNRGVVQDAGPASGGSLTGLGITSGNLGSLCINDAATGSGGWHSLCAGASPTLGGVFSFQNFGNAAPLGYQFQANGNTVMSLSSSGVTFPFGLSMTNGAFSGTLGVTGAATLTNTLNVTGQTTLGNVSASTLTIPNNAVGGGTPSYFLNISGHLSSAITANGNVGWNGITVANDNAADSGTSPNVVDFLDNHNYGGTSFSGGRTGILFQFTQNAAITSTPSGTVISGLVASLKANNSWGGTNLYSGAVGALNGLNPSIQFQAGATDMIGGSGIEINYSGATGSSRQHFNYVQAVALANHITGAAASEAAYAFGAQNGAAATATADLLVGGRGGAWALSPTLGEVIRIELSNNYTSSPSTLYRGTDYLLGNISNAAFLSQGFRVDGQTGAVRSGTCYLTPASTGASLDCSGNIGTAVALVAGGSNWPTDSNTYYATDAYDGVYKLTLSGGAVTALTIYRAPYVSGATPSNPVTLTPDPLAAVWGATGLTVNLTWAARSELSLNPSGGLIIASALPTAAPATHCAVWSNAGVLTLTTCP